MKVKKTFFKNYYYFKKRYLSYRKNDYFINKFIFRNKTSFFIIKRNRDKSGYSNVILDHFGSKKIYNKHLSNTIKNLDKLIFLSNIYRNNSKYKIVNSLNIKIGFIKKFNAIKKNNIFKNNEIQLGDTDIFITL